MDGIVVLSSGDLSNRLPVSPARDGIDAVTTGINLLAEELQSMYEDLEVRVAERTALLEAAKAELRRVINTDELTGLASRSLLQEKVAEAVAGAGTGQPAGPDPDGPRFLPAHQRQPWPRRRGRRAARGGPAASRGGRAGHLIARLSGDEFAVLVADQDTESVLQTAARLGESLKDRIVAGGVAVALTAGTGVRLGEPGLRGEELIRDADIAMHEAKKRGRDTLLVFSAAMHEAAKQRVHQVAELRTALAMDQLELEYQPIMDLRTGAIAGAEALIRWRHPPWACWRRIPSSTPPTRPGSPWKSATGYSGTPSHKPAAGSPIPGFRRTSARTSISPRRTCTTSIWRPMSKACWPSTASAPPCLNRDHRNRDHARRPGGGRHHAVAQ